MLTVRRAVAVALLVAAGASCASAPTIVEVRAISGPDAEHPFAFAPSRVEIRAGDRVRFVNGTDAYHTITFADFNHALFQRGDQAERDFATAGTYAFHCQPHAEFMSGTVVVR